MLKIFITILVIIFGSSFAYCQTYSDITYDAGTNLDIGSGADVCATNIYINGTYSGGGTICSGPLPVMLSSFTSSVSKNSVLLRWKTESEINNAGFDIERKTLIVKGGTLEWSKIAFVQGNGTTNEPKQYGYEDKKLRGGLYQYRLKQFDNNGNFEYYNLANDVTIAAPKNFYVSQNYPNPSNPKSRIEYQLPFDSKVTIKIYDMLGREAATLVNEFKQADYYTVEFDGTNFASGVYYYHIVIHSDKLSAGDYVEIKKMVLIK